MKTHGDPGWESFPSYLDVAIPRVLKLLKDQNLTITFFIVGQDAALEKNFRAIKQIADAGHELGNHSFHHEQWLHLYTYGQIEEDIVSAEQHIERITGQKPIGFRGPGYCLSKTTLSILKNRGYLYDASTFPTYIGPLARKYYFLSTQLTPEQKHQRELLFGNFRDGFKPIHPYYWIFEDNNIHEGLFEIPLTTLPVLKIPFHISYLLYIFSISPLLAECYFRMALIACKLAGIHPSLLIHPLDFMGREDVKELAFFPAMNMSRDKKIQFVNKIVQIYARQFTVVPLAEYTHRLAAVYENSNGRERAKVQPLSSVIS
jgi:hypothetical protein